MPRNSRKNSFDMSDLLEQIKQVRRSGTFRKDSGDVPRNVRQDHRWNGAGGRTGDQISGSNHQFDDPKEERANPDIINPARKRRIAAGSGTDGTTMSTRLLNQHKRDCRELIKHAGGNGKGSKRRRRMRRMGLAMPEHMLAHVKTDVIL